MNRFFRYPHTPHLAWLSTGSPRDDKVLSPQEAARLLRGPIVLEEKVDGANLGISLSASGDLQLQNRGQYLEPPFAGQFARLPGWMTIRRSRIEQVLLEHADQHLMLFGEWCAARHSLNYSLLPDWFLFFDVYEAASGRFWSTARRDALAARLGLMPIRRVAAARYTLSQLMALLPTLSSEYGDGPVEGIVVRRESADWCEQRAKLVRPDFAQSITEHWRKRRIEWNRLAASAGV
jgi:ATP-dependent RNA circularization protein (DNA/RNA ligase family)